MDKLYLLHEENTDNFKIGYTRGSVKKRLKSLQTGSSNELRIINYFESDYAKLMEVSLHNRFSHVRRSGEWFELPAKFVINFIDECKGIERNFKYLDEHNSFFNK